MAAAATAARRVAASAGGDGVGGSGVDGTARVPGALEAVAWDLISSSPVLQGDVDVALRAAATAHFGVGDVLGALRIAEAARGLALRVADGGAAAAAWEKSVLLALCAGGRPEAALGVLEAARARGGAPAPELEAHVVTALAARGAFATALSYLDAGAARGDLPHPLVVHRLVGACVYSGA